MNMGTKKNALLYLCLYYKGEDECTFKDDNKKLFWTCERWWYEQTALSNDAGCERISPLLDEYFQAGLSGFEPYDNTPITLKAVIFNRHCKLSERVDVEEFKRLYLDEYKKEG